MHLRRTALTALTIIAILSPLAAEAATKPSDLSKENVNRTVASDSKGVLAAPANLSVDLVNDTEVILVWDEVNDANIVEFVILRTDSADKAPTEIARVPVSETSYTDDTSELDKAYTYRVQSYAPGYVAGDSELKSILIKPAGEAAPAAAILTQASNDSSDAAAPGGNFWMNLVAGNLVILGVLLLIYSLIRNLIWNRFHQTNPVVAEMQKPVSVKDKLLYEKRFKNLTVNAHMGSRDVDVVDAATDKYFASRNQKVEEWMAEPTAA